VIHAIESLILQMHGFTYSLSQRKKVKRKAQRSAWLHCAIIQLGTQAVKSVQLTLFAIAAISWLPSLTSHLLAFLGLNTWLFCIVMYS